MQCTVVVVVVIVVVIVAVALAVAVAFAVVVLLLLLLVVVVVVVVVVVDIQTSKLDSKPSALNTIIDLETCFTSHATTVCTFLTSHRHRIAKKCSKPDSFSHL